jgi:dihydropteroate synthase
LEHLKSSSAGRWRLGTGKSLDFSSPRILAIVNCTPDSFFDGGRFLNPAQAADAAAQMVGEGADALDIGGESTRPGVARVPAEEQIARLIPVIREIRKRPDLAAIPITVDTTLDQVAEAALEAGADGINDVSAGLESPGMLDLAARRSAGMILMHRLRPPPEDSYSDRYASLPVYGDVVREVGDFLRERAGAAVAAGIHHESIILDPGLGFGKSVEQNIELVRRAAELCRGGYPILGAASRKSFIARASGTPDAPPADRLPGSIAFSIMQYLGGVRFFRVHDVAAQAAALRAAHAIAVAPPVLPRE